MFNLFKGRENEVELTEFGQELGYGGKDWFVQYCADYNHQARINEILNIKEYLAGKHDINRVTGDIVRGQAFKARRITLQYARKLIDFSAAYLIGNQVTLSGDEKVLSEIRKIWKTSDYDAKDFMIVQSVLRYGNIYEYVYIKNDQNKKISSKLIQPEDSYPVFDEDGEYVAFVEHWITNGISYWNVYTPEKVEKYSNAKGNVLKIGEYANLSGLPIIHRNENPLDERYGRSDLEDYKSILDSMEMLLSKSVLGHYLNMFGVGILKGQPLYNKNAKGEQTEAINPDLVGAVINIDNDSEFGFVTNDFNSQSFETLYQSLTTALLDVSQVPGVAMGKIDISNLSETSLKMMYSAASLKALVLEKFVKESFKVRLEKMRILLSVKGIRFTDEEWETLDISFTYALPTSDKDIIENLVKLKGIGALSDETLQRMNPYVKDTASELNKIANDDGDRIEEE